MVKTYEDVKKCEGYIDDLERLGIPSYTIRNLRRWLEKEARRIKKKPDRPGAAGAAVGARPYPPTPAASARSAKEIQ